MPQGLEDVSFYQPVPRGLEIKIQEKMRWMAERNEAARAGQPRRRREG